MTETLSDMRNKLKTMKFFNVKGELITNDILDEIRFQDKEFIKLLKDHFWFEEDWEFIHKIAGEDLIK